MADDSTTPVTEPKAGDADTEPIRPEDNWQAKARKHERDLKSERKAREAAEALLAEHTEATKTETEKAIEKARKEAADAAKAEVSGTYKTRILNAEIRAQAAGKFANPKLAGRLLDLDVDSLFDDDGEIDAKAIASAVDDFLKQDENAGLRVNGATSRPSGSADAGKGAGAAAGVGDMNDFIRAGIKRT